MIKIISATLALFLLTASAYASEPRVSGWADINEFCNIETFYLDDEEMCVDLLTKYQEATREHFESLSAAELRRISDRINRLADKGSERARKLREAVDNIGETLRKRIEIPEGVRNIPRQDQYIQQSIE